MSNLVTKLAAKYLGPRPSERVRDMLCRLRSKHSITSYLSPDVTLLVGTHCQTIMISNRST